MKSIKKAMQYGALAVIAGVITYQASAGLLNIGGEDDRGSTVSVFGRDTQEGSGSIARVGGLSVGGEHVVDYERKKSRVCDKGRYDARHNRTRSYFRGSNQDEYDRCKADEQAQMNAQGKQPAKRGRTSATSETRRTKRMSPANE